MNEKDFNANKHFGASWGDQAEQARPAEKKTDGESLEQALDRVDKIVAEARALRERWELWAASQPQTKACPKHSNRILKIRTDISADRSFALTKEAGTDTFTLIYESCPECYQDAKVANESNWLKRVGVPEILLHGSFKTWRIEREEDKTNLATAKDFVGKGRGFLMMTGNFGDGKSLLAVAVLREFLGGKFITQNNLLIDLRRGYRDPKAQDVIRICQQAKCLVVDDFGLSMGGADELPMLQSIMDHRHGEKLPTVVTSNLTIGKVYDLMGERLADRFKQSLFRHLAFTGASSRAAERQNYFAD
jgi:DNA replication protein DnaC